MAKPVNIVPQPAAPADVVEALTAAFDPAALDHRLGLSPGQVPARLWQAALVDPARRVLARSGKRFRARMVETAWRLAGGGSTSADDDARLATLGQIVEVLHAGSLIVDDIEDAAETRRGQPALHHVVGMPLALNTGNWMYFWPFERLDELALAPALALAAHRDLAATLASCHNGQALDLSVRIGALRRAEVADVVAAIGRLKTGSLLGLAARLGARCAGADSATIAALGDFAIDLGAGLQMLDDLSSVTSAARAEKGWEDLRHGRATWPWAWLAGEVDDDEWAAIVVDQVAAEQAASAGDDDARGRVGALAAQLRDRVEHRGRRSTHLHLEHALDRLRARFAGVALGDVEREVARLEESYA